MAGQKATTIEYVFEGNILNLQQAIKQITKNLNDSTKRMKKYQQGTLTEEQQNQVKAARKLLKTLKDINQGKLALNDQNVKKAKVAGQEALKNSRKLNNASLTIEKQKISEIAREQKKAADKLKADKEAEVKKAKATQEKISDYTSVAAQESAKGQAFLLENYSKSLSESLSPKAYKEITSAVQEYRAVSENTGTSQEKLAQVTEKLDTVFDNYSSTLKNMKHALEENKRGISSFQDVVDQAKLSIEAYTKSFSFWLQMFRKVVNYIKQGITNFADYVESLNYLEAASKSSAEAMSAFAKQQALSFGLDPTEVNTAAASFYSFADSMGFSSDQSQLLSENLTKLSQDMASLHNTSVEEASVKLRSALAGQSRALAVWGINVNDANVEEWLLTQGIDASMKTMNEASQAAARYAFILDKSSSAQGDLARTIQSPANQMKILTTQLKLLGQNLGAIATTFFMPLLKILNGVLQPLNAFLQGISSISASGFSSSVGEQEEALESLEDQAEDTSDSLNGLTGIDEINQEKTKEQTTEAGVVSTDINDLLKSYENGAQNVGKLTEAFGLLGESIGHVWALINNDTNFSAFGMVLEGVGWSIYYICWVLELVTGLIDKAPDWLKNIIKILSEVILSIMGIAIAVKIATSSFNLLKKSIFGVIAGFVKFIAKATLAGIKAISTAFKNAILSGSYWKVAIAAIAAAGVAAAAVAAIVFATTATVQSEASSVQNSDMNAKVDTPAMAKGGIVTGPTLALTGEGQFNEAVIPLGNSPQFTDMKEEIATKVLEKTNRVEQVNNNTLMNNKPIVLNLNGREFARAIIPDLRIAQPQTGVKIQR